MKKLYVILMLLMVGCLTACSGKKDNAKQKSGDGTSAAKATEEAQATSEVEEEGEEVYHIVKPEKAEQTESYEKNETIAIIHVEKYGDIYLKFFPDEAPKAVENFITHAREGYYDGITFHRIVDGSFIQGGDPAGDGTGGESIWGEPFEDEFSEEILPIRGALCMANAGANTNGSQFFIVQSKDSYEGYFDQFDLTEEQKEKFKEYGGTPWLKGVHTVFGHVFKGMDVVDAIAAAETGLNDMPANPIVIEKIEIQN